MEKEIEKLKNFVSEFDYLYQEGVVFSKQEIDTIQQQVDHLNGILNDSFLQVN